jgi:hypothetical protein
LLVLTVEPTLQKVVLKYKYLETPRAALAA